MKKIDLLNSMELFRGAAAPMKRMNQELLDYFASTEALSIRANCAAGVRVVMQSDAEKLSIKAVFGGAARQIFSVDVEINGEIKTLDCTQEQSLDLTPGKKEIIIHLPHLAVLEDFQLYVNQTASVEAIPENRPKLLVCGDSILQGMTCTSPAKASVPLAAKALDMDFHNTSVGGAVMQAFTVRETLKFSSPSDTVIVGLGINDAARNTDIGIFRKECNEALQALSRFAGRKIIITPIPSTIAVEAQRETYSNIIREEQSKFPDVELLEGSSFFPADPDLYADGLHPNNKGMQIYAQGLIKAVKEKR